MFFCEKEKSNFLLDNNFKLRLKKNAINFLSFSEPKIDCFI